MEDFDLVTQLQTTKRISVLGWWGLVAIIIGTVGLALYKKKRGVNYKLVIIVGVGIVFFYLLIMAFVLRSLVNPIYNLQ